MVILTLPVIPDDNRKQERDLWPELEATRAGILGAVLNALSAAIRNQYSVSLNTLPRMADFAVWAAAGEEGFGFKKHAFIKAYRENRKGANAAALDSSLTAGHILALMDSKDKWVGTAGELLREITSRVDASTQERREWPKTPRALSNELSRIAPNLRAEGLNLHRDEHRGTGGRRNWSIERIHSENSPEPSPLPSHTSQLNTDNTQHTFYQSVPKSGHRDGPETQHQSDSHEPSQDQDSKNLQHRPTFDGKDGQDGSWHLPSGNPRCLGAAPEREWEL